MEEGNGESFLMWELVWVLWELGLFVLQDTATDLNLLENNLSEYTVVAWL